MKHNLKDFIINFVIYLKSDLYTNTKIPDISKIQCESKTQ